LKIGRVSTEQGVGACWRWRRWAGLEEFFVLIACLATSSLLLTSSLGTVRDAIEAGLWLDRWTTGGGQVLVALIPTWGMPARRGVLSRDSAEN
jgi:hypothetical protein